MIDVVVTIAVVVVPSVLVLVLIDVIHGSVAAYRTRHEELGAAGVFWDQPVPAMTEVRRTAMPVQDRPADRSDTESASTGTPAAGELKQALPVIARPTAFGGPERVERARTLIG